MVHTEEEEKKNRVISGVSTSVLCILMFFLFWLYNFHFELPPPVEESSVAVSLGQPDAGGPEEIPVEAESAPSVPSIPAPDAYEQTVDPDAVAAKKSNEIKKDKPVDKPQEDDLLKTLNKGKANQKPVNAGDGDKPGAQGDPNGTPGGDPKGTLGGTGTGSGPGVSTSFKGRTFKLGVGKNNCNQEGKVVLEVTLMQDGSIRYDGVSPSSLGSDCLEKVAINYLRSSSFNASQNPISVEGTITFNFKLK